jgi:dihydroneopterin aldolase
MRIFIEGLEFLAAHGVYEEERREGRRFRVDLSVELSRNQGCESDELEDTIDYRDLSQAVLDVAEGPSVSLIEHMGEQILSLLFMRHTSIERAQVTIRKFATGVPGEPACVGITLERMR